MKFFFGVDLGTMQDYTALSVMERIPREVEKEARPGTRDFDDEPKRYKAYYILRYLERLPLGASYPNIVRKISDMMSHEKLEGKTALVVDTTGLGKPVVDMMREVRLSPIEIVATSGTVTTKRDAGYNVPKGELVSALNLLFQSRRIKLPVALKLKTELIKEFEHFQLTLRNTKADSYESALASIHDDLVMATAMPAWYAERMMGSTFAMWSGGARPNMAKDPLRDNL